MKTSNKKNGLGGEAKTEKLKEYDRQTRFCIDEALPGGCEHNPALAPGHKDELDHKVK